MELKVSEIFKSIEGEGIWVGIPTVFIRLSGCSIKCTTCDTKYAWIEGEKMPVLKVVDYVTKNFRRGRVSITGGEPLDQIEAVTELVEWLKNYGFYPINLETSGQIYSPEVSIFDTWSVDLKTPSSGVEANLDAIKQFIMLDPFNVQVKAVVKDRNDLRFTLTKFKYLSSLFPKFKNFVITPFWSPGKPLNKKRVEFITSQVSKTDIPVRVIVQQHKIMYGSSRKGV